jgi:trigger factor
MTKGEKSVKPKSKDKNNTEDVKTAELPMNGKIRIEKTVKGNNEIEISVEASIELANKAYNVSFREVAKTIDIAGFRKGKAPKNAIENVVGKAYISRKAFDYIFPELLIDVSKEGNLDIVDVVEILSFEIIPDKPLKFSAVVEVKPEVNLGKYTNRKINAKKLIYDKEEFTNKTLERVVNSLITFKETDKSVKEGDCVTLDFEGKFEDGSEVPGGKV